MPYTVLDNFLVLDLSNRLSGSFCAKTLGLYGCDVIKVEPVDGDPNREWKDYIDDDKNTINPLFLHLNVGKKSLSLDIESPEGSKILKQLIKKADIVVETFKPGYLDSIGLGYESSTKDNQGLIMTSVTPFGQSGPYRNYDYTELTIFAMSGAMHREGLPDRSPLRYGGEIAQYYSGNAAAAATSVAIFRRLQTNLGEWIDISIQECMAGHPHQIGRRAPFIYSGETDPRTEPRILPGIGESYAIGTFRCADGYVSFLPLGARMWPNIARMIGRDDLITHPDYLDSEKRLENRKSLETIFQSWLDQHTREEIFSAVQKAGVPGSPILRSDEVTENEQFKARDYFTELNYPSVGTQKYTGDPFRLTSIPKKDALPPPTLGQHNHIILENYLNYTNSDIVRLKKSKVI